MSVPLVSVILPVYNAEDYVQDAIQSILNQTFTDFELIILNDGSTDQSEFKILQFSDSRIRYIKNEVNLKLISTLNLGLKMALGKYIARIDADDIALPQRFARQVDFLEKNFDYGIVGSFAETFGNKSEVLKYAEEDEDIRYAFITHNPFIHSTVMIRSIILHKNNLKYSHDQLHVEDYALWIDILEVSKAKILSEILIKYRVHNQQISEVYSIKQLSNTYNVQSYYLKKLGFEIGEVDFILSLHRPVSLNVVDLIDALHKVDKISDKVIHLNKKINFTNYLKRLIKNQIFNKKSISFNELILILKLKSFFNYKQKITLVCKAIIRSFTMILWLIFFVFIFIIFQ